MQSGILSEPVLVGRERELEQLQQYLSAVLQGKGTTVFVSGEAGAGKTRFVNEFLTKAKEQPITILRGWCLSNAAVPYFPFFEAFNQYFSSEKANSQVEVKNWFLGPTISEFGNSQVITPQVWKDQTFTAVANTLSSISSSKPAILFIDDIHWADSASLALINYLAYSIQSEKVLVLATFRSEALVSDTDGKPHPLLETLRLLRRQDLTKEISISSLDKSGVCSLAENMLGGEVQQGLAQKLADESQGNPLFVVESLRMLYERKELACQDNQWQLASNTIGIPPKIKDIILQRLSAISRNQRSMLDFASVIGEKFSADLLAQVQNQDLIEIIKLLDTIANDTSLVSCEGELYRFDHARTRDAIYDNLSSSLKRAYHSKVAEQLESNSAGGILPLSDLAYQFAQAGNKEKAVKYAMAAGQDALVKWSNAEAAKQFSFVVQAIGDRPEAFEKKMVALEKLGDAFYAGNNFKQAITVYEQVADQVHNETEKLRTLRKAMQASFYLADVSLQIRLNQKSEEVKTADRLEAARMIHQKTSIMLKPEDWITATKLWPDVLGIFEEEYALVDSAYILLWMGFGQACVGNLEYGISCNLRSIALYEEMGDFRSQIEAYAYAGGSFQAAMLVKESDMMLAKAIEVNEKYKIWDYVRLFPAYVWEAMNLVQTDVPLAISKAQKALEYFKRTDSYLYAGPVHGILIVSYALAGDTAHVDEYFGKLMSLPQDVLSNAPTQIYIGPTMLTYYAAKGEYEKAEKTFNDWQHMVRTYFPSPFLDASSRQLYAWGLGKQGKMEEAAAQLQEAQRVIQESVNRLSHVNILASTMTLTRPGANKDIPIRLDIVNVSTKQGAIKKVENLPKEVEIEELSPNCILKDRQVTFKESAIMPFSVKTMKLMLKTSSLSESRSFILNPQITFIDDLGQTKTCEPRAVTITIQPKETSTAKVESDEEIDILKRFGLTR